MKHVFPCGLLCLLSACAGYQPVVDMKGVDQAKYQQDLAECQSYAKEVNVTKQAAAGAVIGGGLQAAVSAVLGGNAERSAAAGAILGAAGGAGEGAKGQTDVIRNCLRGRGYSVLR